MFLIFLIFILNKYKLMYNISIFSGTASVLEVIEPSSSEEGEEGCYKNDESWPITIFPSRSENPASSMITITSGGPGAGTFNRGTNRCDLKVNLFKVSQGIKKFYSDSFSNKNAQYALEDI